MAASVEDIAALCSNIIDIYLCRPETNCRLAYIQTDDVIELGLKTWLQINVSGWSPEDPQRSSPGNPYYKSFPTVVSEITSTPGVPGIVSTLLARSVQRRNMRNRFFHDHNQAGLTIEQKRCIEAIIDMVDLFEALFQDFKQSLCRYAPEHAQYKLLRLHAYALDNPGINELLRRFFRNSLRKHPEQVSISRKGNRIIAYGSPSPSFEWLATLQEGADIAAECDRIAQQQGVSL